MHMIEISKVHAHKYIDNWVIKFSYGLHFEVLQPLGLLFILPTHKYIIFVADINILNMLHVCFWL